MLLKTKVTSLLSFIGVASRKRRAELVAPEGAGCSVQG